MTRRLSALLAALLITASPHLAQATAAQDQSECLGDHPDQWLEACTILITQGRLGRSDLAKAYYNRANAHSDRGEWDLAISDYGEAIARDAKFSAAYRYRGDAYDGKHDVDLAVRDYEKAIALEPKYAGAYRFRAQIHFGRGEYDLAIQFDDRAILLNPKDALAYVDRGIAEWRQGHGDLAVRDLKHALELNPDLRPAKEKLDLYRREIADRARS